MCRAAQSAPISSVARAALREWLGASPQSLPRSAALAPPRQLAFAQLAFYNRRVEGTWRGATPPAAYRGGARPVVNESSKLVPDDLLAMLRCPVDNHPLQAADASLVAELNRQITAGTLTNVSGEVVTQLLDGGLVCVSGDRLYPVVDRIPVMLPDEAIALPRDSA